MSLVSSVNVGHADPNPYKSSKATGIGKHPQPGPVEVRPPGKKTSGLGSGLVGDFIGDRKHHGGDDQAVYAFQREDLDAWEARLDRSLPNGYFGENLTTTGIDVNEALVGERWRVGSPERPEDQVELQVTSPRIPCSTFRGWMGEKGWAKMFTADARPGTYLRVTRAGRLHAGDAIEVVERPDHDVTVSLVFRAITTERELLPRLLAAEAYLEDETIALVHQQRTITLD